MDEIWKPVRGYEGFYSVSNFGRVRRDHSIARAKAGHIMKQTPVRGYLHVGLSKHRNSRVFRVHRLVWQAFNGQIPPGHVVNHKNGAKADNHLTNLEAVTTAQNVRHAYLVLGREATGSKLSGDDAKAIREARAAGETYRQIAIRYGVGPSCVASVCHGETWVDAEGPVTPPRKMRRTPQEGMRRFTQDVVDCAVTCYHGGMAARDIADELGISQRTIFNWIHGYTRSQKTQND